MSTPDSTTSVPNGLEERVAELERQLADARAQLDRVPRKTAVVVYQLHRDQHGVDRFKFARGDCQEIFGLDAEEIMRDTNRVRNMIVPEDRDRVYRAIGESHDSLDQLEQDYRIINRRGERKWLRAVSCACRQEDGTVVWVGALSDISNEATEDRALLKDDKLLAAGERIARLGSWQFLITADQVSATDELYRIFGLDPSVGPLRFEQVLELIHPDDREKIRRDTFKSIEQRAFIRNEFRIIRPDGEVRYLFSDGDVDCDEHGHVQKLIGCIQDITSRKRHEHRRVRELNQLEARVQENASQLQVAQEIRDRLEARVQESTLQLLHSEALWHSVVTSSPDQVLIINPDGTIRYINRSDLGYDVNDVIGSSCYDYLPIESREETEQLIAHVLATGERSSFEVSAIGPTGESFWFAARLAPFLDENDEVIGVTCIITNITERKVMEHQLRSEERLLRQLLKLQERERKLVAHDIHDGFVQDVIGAKMMLEGALPVLSRAAPTAHASLTIARERLTSAITEARQLMAELSPMVIEDFGLIETLRAYAEKMTTLELHVQFTCDVQFTKLDPALEGTVYRIVQEALNNVKRHSGSPTATVELQEVDQRLRLTIADQGCGFELKDVPRERFGVRGIIERARLFRGHAHVTSAPGQGTTITVDLPTTIPADTDDEKSLS